MGTKFGQSPASSGGPSDKFKAAFGDMLTRAGDGSPGRSDPLAPFLLGAPKRDKGSVGDVLATVLAVAADATDPEGRGIYTRHLAQNWAQRGNAYEKAMQAYQDRQRMANLPGMTPREMAAYVANPEAWGSSMSSAAVSPYEAATLNPGDQRFLGQGREAYQAPTRGQLFAESLGLEPGSDAYNAALRDQEMGAQGPTAFANDMTLEGVRQRGRSDLEGVRQRNRMNLRGAPTYRDLKAPPPRFGGRPVAGPTVPTARDAKGNTIYYRGGKWVDMQGNPVR